MYTPPHQSKSTGLSRTPNTHTPVCRDMFTHTYIHLHTPPHQSTSTGLLGTPKSAATPSIHTHTPICRNMCKYTYIRHHINQKARGYRGHQSQQQRRSPWRTPSWSAADGRQVSRVRSCRCSRYTPRTLPTRSLLRFLSPDFGA